MNSADWKNIKQILSATLDLPEAERRDFLARETDDSIRREVEKLLAAHEKAEDFIEKPFADEYGLSETGFEENLIGKRIDDYSILEKIGEGGMGAVFLAEHRGEDFSQRVAIKLIKRGMDTNAVLKRFLRERQILAQLEHPFIAHLFDGGSTEDGLPYLVMEFAEGENIREFCNEHQFDTKERLELFLKVCQAVTYAHQKLIVHRDLKPSNIIITQDGTPKLLDFGIAKLLSPDWNASTAETTTQMRMMTPEYASPEQIRGEATATASDVYSLGIVLYELLTGTRPYKFKTKNPMEISQELLTQEPVRPSDCGMRNAEELKNTSKNKQIRTSKGKQNPQSAIRNLQSLKGDLDNIILKAIRKEPNERYQSVEEFCNDISRYLNGLPVKATADTRFYRFGKFYQRHRTGVFVSAFVALILISSTSITGFQYFRAERERAKAEKHFEQLREVAKSLLTETNTALKNLPEGLEIRKSIVEKSVAVLDEFAAEESENAEFLTELADAYAELGGIQHWNFRQTDEALESFQKSFVLREKAISLKPQNLEYYKKLHNTIGGIHEIYVITNREEKIIETVRISREYSLKVLTINPKNVETLFNFSIQADELSERLKKTGNDMEAEQFRQESIESLDRVIELQTAKEPTPANQSTLAYYLMQKGANFEKTGQDEEALKTYQTLVEIAKNAFLADDSQRFAFNHTARGHRLMADIYRKRGDWQKALEMYQFSLKWIKQHRQNKNIPPSESSLGEAVYTMRVGVALDKIGRKTEGKTTFERGLQDYYKYLDIYTKDGLVLIYAPEFLQIAAEFYTDRKQTDQAAEIWLDYTQRIENFLEKTPNETTLLKYLSRAYQNSADIYVVQNPQKAKAYYEKALEILKKTMDNSADFQKQEADLIKTIENLK